MLQKTVGGATGLLYTRRSGGGIVFAAANSAANHSRSLLPAGLYSSLQPATKSTSIKVYRVVVELTLALAFELFSEVSVSTENLRRSPARYPRIIIAICVWSIEISRDESPELNYSNWGDERIEEELDLIAGAAH